MIEALSVLIQVFSFQTFRKRVFLMAPIHHHFELMAWSETKIILRFWIVAAICAAIGFTIYQAVDHVRPPLPGGPYLVVGLARSGVGRRTRAAGAGGGGARRRRRHAGGAEGIAGGDRARTASRELDARRARS